MSSAANRPVFVGDTWRSRDPRDDGRKVKVTAVDGHPSGYVFYESRDGRQVKARLRTFHRLYAFVDGPYA